MWFEIANMPYISLIWLGIGFCIVLLGVVMLAHLYNKQEDYTQYDDQKVSHKAEELLSYFLEEEEKKNDAFRKGILEENTNRKKTVKVESAYEEIIKLHNENMSIDAIAKKMNMGVGEVRLIISLYTMR